MLNKVILSGRLGKLTNKKLFGNPDGDNCCCYFDVACSKYNRHKEDTVTDWIHCKTWGKQAKRFIEYSDDGLFIEIEGYLKNEKNEEIERTYVIVTSFQFYKTAPRIALNEDAIDQEER